MPRMTNNDPQDRSQHRGIDDLLAQSFLGPRFDTEIGELFPEVVGRFDEVDGLDDLGVKGGLLAEHFAQFRILLGKLHRLFHARVGGFSGTVAAQQSLGSAGVHVGSVDLPSVRPRDFWRSSRAAPRVSESTSTSIFKSSAISSTEKSSR